MDLATSDVLALLLASSSDAQKNARLTEMLDKQKELDAAKAELDGREAVLAQATADAARMRREAAAIEAGHEDRGRQLDEREKNLADVLERLNAEKAALEKIRHQVDGEQAERRDQLEALASAVTNREVAVGEREKFVAAREQAAGEAQAKHEGLLARARMLLDLDATVDVPKRGVG